MGREARDDDAAPSQPLSAPGEASAPEPAVQGAERISVPPAAPVLTPPTLMTVPADASAEAVGVMVDRGFLTPQLRVTALEGRVTLALLVRADGTVAQVSVRITSGSGILDALAVKAAGAWHFRPATRDGVATESWALIPVHFVVR